MSVDVDELPRRLRAAALALAANAVAARERLSLPTHTSDGAWNYGDLFWTRGFLPGALLQASPPEPETEAHDLAWRTAVELVHGLGRDFARPKDQDIGFVARFSAAVGADLRGDHSLRELALVAAERLADFRDPSGFLRCTWIADGDYAGVDGFMNTTLWCWAYRTTGLERYARWARESIDVGIEQLIRDDGRTCEYATRETNGRLVWLQKNSATDASVWSRGHAWVVYGLSEAVATFGEPSHAEALDRSVGFWAGATDDGATQPWDLAAAQDSELRDTSAAAVIASALLGDSDALEPWRHHGRAALDSILETAIAQDPSGTRTLVDVSRPARLIDRAGESAIWGEYFLAEAVGRASRTAPSLETPTALQELHHG